MVEAISGVDPDDPAAERKLKNAELFDGPGMPEAQQVTMNRRAWLVLGAPPSKP